MNTRYWIFMVSHVSYINRIQNLEKDLYYYKKTARCLKKKIRELRDDGVISPQGMLYTSHVHITVVSRWGHISEGYVIHFTWQRYLFFLLILLCTSIKVDDSSFTYLPTCTGKSLFVWVSLLFFLIICMQTFCAGFFFNS